jgi:endonuclease YncB( thermonuclease family)
MSNKRAIKKRDIPTRRKSSNKALAPLIILILILSTSSILHVTLRATSTDSLYVKKVFDGDSILLSDGREVRYIGIDAPETGGKRPKEYYGAEARELHRRLVSEKEIRLEFDSEQKDRYGRTLAYVYVGDRFINSELVANGAALAVPYPPNLKQQKELSRAMEEARRGKRGLWAHPEEWMITPDDTETYIGLSKTVVGKVNSTMEGSYATLLRLDGNFSVLIPQKYLLYFIEHAILSPAQEYQGKVLEITGTIYHKDGPRITVRHPGQIFVRE